MPINEIEVPGSSLSLNCYKCQVDSAPKLVIRIAKEGDAFNLEEETPGFHDLDHDENIVRGYYSSVVAFEVDEVVEGLTTSTLHNRIDSCEFLLAGGYAFFLGKSASQKSLAQALSTLTGYGVAALELEFAELAQFHDRLSQVKSVALTNPKDREIRRAKLTGQIESYTDYNVVDPRNHGIDSVSGLVDSPIGPMTVTVNRKGALRLAVRKGFILPVDCLLWVVSLVMDAKPPEFITPMQKKADEDQAAFYAEREDGEPVLPAEKKGVLD